MIIKILNFLGITSVKGLQAESIKAFSTFTDVVKKLEDINTRINVTKSKKDREISKLFKERSKLKKQAADNQNLSNKIQNFLK